MRASPPPPTSLAPHHLRFFALMFDYLLAVILLRLADELSLGRHWDLNPATWAPQYLSPVWYAGLPLLVLCRDLVGSRSPGKWVTGIALADATDLSLQTPWTARLLRNLPLLLLPLEAVLVFTDAHMRRLGDHLAGTVVVAAPRAAPLARRWLVVAMLFLGMLLASFFIGPWNLHRSAAYQEAYRLAAGHPEVGAAVGEPFTLDDAPVFELPGDPRKGAARVTFQAEGPRGTVSVAVVLRLDPAGPAWVRESVQVQAPAAAPPPPERDAPPAEGAGGR